MRDRETDERPTVLVIAFSDLRRDPRLDRHLRALGEMTRVIAAGYAAPTAPVERFIKIEPLGGVPGTAPPAGVFRSRLGRLQNVPRRVRRVARELSSAVLRSKASHERRYWGRAEVQRALAALGGVTVDLVIANDLETLPLALRIAGTTPVVYDAHEYAPREYDSVRFRLLDAPFLRFLHHRYVPAAAATITVSEGIADQFVADGLERPAVITNACAFADLEPRPPHAGRVRLVHHGGASPTRRLGEMIRMMDHLDERFELHFLLVGFAAGYIEELKQSAASRSRVFFHEPVAMRDLPARLNEYDLGVYLLPPTNFNNRHALPNKLFEFVQARLGVAIGPSPEMARVVHDYGLGIVSESFEAEALARHLASLDDAGVWALKQAAHRAARALSASIQAERLCAIIRSALAGIPGRHG